MKSKTYELINSFKKIDLFTKPVQLMIKKEEGHKTFFGAFLTLVLLFIIIVILINDLIELKQGSNLQVISNEVHKYQPDLVRLLPGNFSLQIGIQDPKYKTYIDESVWVLKFKAVYKEQKLGDDGSQFNSVDIPLIICTNDSIKQKELSETFISARYGDLYCIDWSKISQIELQGQFLAAEYRYLALDIYMCSNTTKSADGPDCKSKEEIASILNHNYLSIQMTTIVTDFSNPKSPYEYQVADFYTSISSKIFKEINFFLQPITTIVDEGVALQDLQTYKALSFEKYNEIIDFTDSDQLVHISMRLDQSSKINQKTYQKLQEVLAQIGGLWNVLFTVTLILQTPFSNLSYRLAIINSLFNFQGQEVDMNSMKRSAEQQRLYPTHRESFQSDIVPSPNSSSTQKFNYSRTRQMFIQKRLQSIMVKHEQLEKQNNLNEKGKLSKQISKSVKAFFDTVKRKLRFSFFQQATFLKFTNNKTKRIQFNYSVEKLEKQLDIIYIIKKLHEIDKLKMILLNPSQLKVFDYLPKPTIPEDPQAEANNNQYYSLLKSHKSNYEKAIEAQQAFSDLAKRLDEPLNKQLISFIDDNMVQLLQVQFQIQHEMQDNQEIILQIPQSRVIEELNEVDIPNLMLSQEEINSEGDKQRIYRLNNRRTE